MLAFYLDEPLSELEQNQVIHQLKVLGITIEESLDFKHITFEFSPDDSDLTHVEIIKIFEKHLQAAAVTVAKPSLFILPKGGFRWGMLLQMAFKNLTNYYPYVVQPWETNANKVITRRERLLVTDINSAMNN